MGPITLGLGPPSLTADGRRRSKGPQGRHGGGFDVAKTYQKTTKTYQNSKTFQKTFGTNQNLPKPYQPKTYQKPSKTNQTYQNLLNPTKTYQKTIKNLLKPNQYTQLRLPSWCDSNKAKRIQNKFPMSDLYEPGHACHLLPLGPPRPPLSSLWKSHENPNNI